MNNAVLNTKEKRTKNRQILEQVYNLPSMPTVMFEVNKLVSNPYTNAADLGRAISKDQGLVTKILTVANSPLYGLPRRVSTIDFAIVILGFDYIKNIVVALSMIEAFKSVSKEYFNQKKYWLHSITVATAAKRISDDLGYHLSGEAFTAGLLHDLGIPIIVKYFSKELPKIQHLVKKEKMTHKEAEFETLGITHEEIGQNLAERWNLPSSLAAAVLNHHRPSKEVEHKEITAIIHLADYLTRKLSLGDFDWDADFEFDSSVISTLNLGDENYVDNLLESYRIQFEEQIDTLNF